MRLRIRRHNQIPTTPNNFHFTSLDVDFRKILYFVNESANTYIHGLNLCLYHIHQPAKFKFVDYSLQYFVTSQCLRLFSVVSRCFALDRKWNLVTELKATGSPVPVDKYTTYNF